MKDFLIEILDYNENVLITETLRNTTKEQAVELAVKLCEKTKDSYCFNLEEILKNESKKDLELGCVLISNEINYVTLELIKFENYDNLLVQRGIKALMGSIVIAKFETFLNYEVIDNNDKLVNEVNELPFFKQSKETTPSNNNLKFALHRINECVSGLQWALIYNDLKDENTQHYLIRLLKNLVKEDLTIYLVQNKVLLN